MYLDKNELNLKPNVFNPKSAKDFPYWSLWKQKAKRVDTLVEIGG